MAGAYKGMKTDATGRTKSRPKYVLIDADVFASPRFQSLSPYSMALYVEFKHRFNGRNNGDLHMSVREAATVLMTGKDQGARALDELANAGFIEICAKGSYRGKQATTWYLSEYPKGKPVQRRVSFKIDNITMFADLIQSQEYRSLKPRSRALFLHFVAGKKSHEARTDGVIMSVALAATALNCSKPTAHKALKELEAAGLIAPEFRGVMGTAQAIGTSWLVAESASERLQNRVNFEETKQGQTKNTNTKIGYVPLANPQEPVQEMGTHNQVNPQKPVQNLGTLLIPRETELPIGTERLETDPRALRECKYG